MGTHQDIPLQACHSTFHTHTKHINVMFHFIHERVTSNKAVLTHVMSKENPADLITRGLDKSQHNYLKRKLGF